MDHKVKAMGSDTGCICVDFERNLCPYELLGRMGLFYFFCHHFASQHFFLLHKLYFMKGGWMMIRKRFLHIW